MSKKIFCKSFENPPLTPQRPQKPAKTQRSYLRENFCDFADILRFSGVNGLFQRSLCIFGLTLLFFNSPLYAWSESILLPHSTREYHQQTIKVGSQDLKITIYASSLTEAEISNFYQTKLVNFGWQLRDLSKEMEVLPKEKKPDVSGLEEMLKKTLYFTKDDTMLNMNFLPPRPNDNQTYFSITIGKLPEPEEKEEEEETLLKPEKLPSISIYPDAQQVYSRKSSSSQIYGYLTDARIEKVASFYKSDMFRFNWSLVAETPLQKTAQDFSKQIEDCPSCSKLPEEIQKSLGSMEMYSASLKFKRGKEICLIGITQDKISGQIDSEISQTRITIVYNSR